MYYITVKDLMDALKTLPADTKVTSIGGGYDGSRRYLNVAGPHCKDILEVDLTWVDNKEVSE